MPASIRDQCGNPPTNDKVYGVIKMLTENDMKTIVRATVLFGFSYQAGEMLFFFAQISLQCLRSLAFFFCSCSFHFLVVLVIPQAWFCACVWKRVIGSAARIWKCVYVPFRGRRGHSVNVRVHTSSCFLFSSFHWLKLQYFGDHGHWITKLGFDRQGRQWHGFIIHLKKRGRLNDFCVSAWYQTPSSGSTEFDRTIPQPQLTTPSKIPLFHYSLNRQLPKHVIKSIPYFQSVLSHDALFRCALASL